MKSVFRYAQSRKDVKRLLEASGFAVPLIETLELRKELDIAITGFLVSVQKPI